MQNDSCCNSSHDRGTIGLQEIKVMMYVNPILGCPLLINQQYDNTKLIVHLVNTISNKGSDGASKALGNISMLKYYKDVSLFGLFVV